MPTTDTSEKGLETLIIDSLINQFDYVVGSPRDYNRDSAVDFVNHTVKLQFNLK